MEYKKKWDNLRKEGKHLYTLRGTQLLVEVLPKEEIKIGDSNLVLATDRNQVMNSSEANSGDVALVMDRGQGYYDAENDEYIPLEIEVGNVVLLPRFSVQYYSTFPGFVGHTENKIGLCPENEVKLVYKDMESYRKAQELLR